MRHLSNPWLGCLAVTWLVWAAPTPAQEAQAPGQGFHAVSCHIQSYFICKGPYCTYAPSPPNHEFAVDSSIIFDFRSHQYTYNYKSGDFEIIEQVIGSGSHSTYIRMKTHPPDQGDSSFVQLAATPGRGNGYAFSFASSKSDKGLTILSGGQCAAVE